ncbi:MAG: cAMP-binding proteins - catabolite gene activator and regulatory subunit of cAMP-dependent protein kinases [uncultured Microvirga sp.]|uniref:cAMP-binding proteins - catabolite gene activator and regulatory subunit of cAMP-dependent protein kinases n=1 Tax=uncultured Microvirga sp. TaxID=412392 RepID=A0A6J4LB50_9HYPH|nr:MAG: cAMP-binding proteins - catabolite gene activator and regulatory subunit of cAMP-dependent protein kinases [uncultured Microvirga sp.]
MPAPHDRSRPRPRTPEGLSASPLLRKLEKLVDLSEPEREALKGAVPAALDVAAHVDLVREGETPSACFLIVEGFACRYKRLSDRRRQITSFQFPGDLCDLPSLTLSVLDHSIATLTPCRVAALPREAVLALTKAFPRIGEAFLRDALIDAAIFREWVVNVGQRSAYERAAHLLCEIYIRFKGIGLAAGETFDLPITQAELADALGISTVHVNRTLQELRGEGLITLKSGSLTILDWEGLKGAAGFKLDYLHQLAA